MIFLPPNLPPSPLSDENTNKNSRKRTLKNRHNTIRARNRMGMSRAVRTSLSTSQGISTLKIVLMYSVIGMILHWLLPIVLLKMNPEMLVEDAQYFGTLYAIIAIGFLLVMSLLKGLISRNRSQPENAETQNTNTQLFGQKNTDK